MKTDLSLYLFAFGGVILVFISFIVFAAFTELIRNINNHFVLDEKKKKEAAVKSRHAA